MKGQLHKWYHHEFSSGATTGPDFKQFVRDFRSELNEQCKRHGMKLHTLYPNHYDLSGFLLNPESNRLVYFNISDVRYFKNEWYDNVMYRNARHDKDWTGGGNQYTSLEDLVECARFTSEREWY
jgi:hypothetical protein